jgi:transposase InsO family protein
MSWKETCAVDERAMFVGECLRGDLSVAELCRRYEVSRKTGYKWLGRYEAEGKAGLKDRSHVPHHCPHGLSEETIEKILEVKKRNPSWGAWKVERWLSARRPWRHWPAVSTIGELFKARGLTTRRKRRPHVPESAPFSGCIGPNDVWTVDFKGWFRTGDGERCDPLTLQDAYSRYLLRCQVVRPDREGVWPVFDAAFREFGLPKAMRSDNGPPFASVAAGGLSKLSVQLIKAGVMPERIRPGKPQENGRHERFHLTLKKDAASPPAASLKAQQRRFDEFRHVYNEERPHQALQQTPPARHYAPSSARYSGRLREPEYSDDVIVRRVRHNGEIRWKGNTIFVSEVLSGEPVGCEEGEDGFWHLTYGPISLGWIDNRGRLVRSRRLRGAGSGTHGRPPG